MVINDWLNITKVEGEGSQKVTLTTPLNEGEERSTTLIVSNGRKSKVVNIKQLKKSEEFKFEWFSKTFNNIPSTGSNADRVLTVFSCNAPCTLIRADIRNSEDYGMDFVTEETLEMTTGINNIYLNAESNVVNDVLQPVRMVVYIVLYKGEYQGTITIFQQGSTPTFTVTPNEIQFHKEGGTKTIEITANTNWRIWGGGEYQAQITLDRTIGKSGTTIVTINAQEYEGVEELVYIMFVGMQGIAKYSTPFTITQDSLDIPQDCFYIEPYNEGESITIEFKDYNYIDALYFIEGETNEWIDFSSSVITNKRIYIKNLNYYRFDVSTYGSPFSITGLCNVGGDITTLLGNMGQRYAVALFKNSDIVDASNLSLPATELENFCYDRMFYNCNSLVNAPSILPATKIGYSCYHEMFWGCNSLVNAPEILATTLGDRCCQRMFEGCKSLVNATSTLPATTLSEYCYYGMFKGCESLVNAPEILATTSEYECCREMFEGCKNLVTAPSILSATTLASGCYDRMFYGCKNLVTAPVLPATTFENSSYNSMFYGCESLVTAPVLPATTLPTYCYYAMFDGCTNLNNITMLATKKQDSSLQYWVQGVSPTGIFYKNPNMDISNFSRGINGIPEGWEVRDYDL